MDLREGDVLELAKGTTVVMASGVAAGELAFAGQALKPLAENVTDGAKEKHVPVIEPVPGGYKVKVGSVPHPMQDDHWIVWIELRAGAQTLRQRLNPGEAPEAVFLTNEKNVTAREYCNKHGLWKA